MTDQPNQERPGIGDWTQLKPPFPAPDADLGFETLCTHYGEDPRDQQGAVTPPIYQTSTFAYPDAEAFARRLTGEDGHYDYTRGGNPTVHLLEAKLAALEGGAWAECFGSGMGAISAAINAFVRAGAHVVCTAQAYGPTRWYLEHMARFGVETTFVGEIAPDAFINAARDNTTIIYLESPTSGRFDLIDIAPITAFARQRGIVTIFDNSWATPYFQRPLERGVDLVVHSGSKYLNGHSDVVNGVVVGHRDEHRQRLWTEVSLCGATFDPSAAWLMIRSLRTLAIRMKQHERSALALARMLDDHPAVARVRHPGLPNHPRYELGRETLRGYAGLFSFDLADASVKAINAFVNRLRFFRIGVSWGGPESLIIASTGFSQRPDRPERLVRVSVGLESADDLLADMRAALDVM